MALSAAATITAICARRWSRRRRRSSPRRARPASLSRSRAPGRCQPRRAVSPLPRRRGAAGGIASRGFERFAAALAAAWSGGRPSALRAFEALGRAYLAFARDEPAYYAAMFETRIAFDSHPGLLAAGDRAFAIVREAAERLTTSLPPGQRPPSLMVALHVWALSHGIASLFVRADPSRRKLPMSPEDLLEAGVLIYLQVSDWRAVAYEVMGASVQIDRIGRDSRACRHSCPSGSLIRFGLTIALVAPRHVNVSYIRMRAAMSARQITAHTVTLVHRLTLGAGFGMGNPGWDHWRAWHATRPLWIVAMLLGSIFWWPVGLALLFFGYVEQAHGILGMRPLRCMAGRSATRQLAGAAAMGGVEELLVRRRPPAAAGVQWQPRLRRIPRRDVRRLEEEQKEFGTFLDRLRSPRTRRSSTSPWPNAATIRQPRPSSRNRPTARAEFRPISSVGRGRRCGRTPAFWQLAAIRSAGSARRTPA